MEKEKRRSTSGQSTSAAEQVRAGHTRAHITKAPVFIYAAPASATGFGTQNSYCRRNEGVVAAQNASKHKHPKTNEEVDEKIA